jgi:hypothetical protein
VEVVGNSNTNNSVVAFDKMEEKVRLLTREGRVALL